MVCTLTDSVLSLTERSLPLKEEKERFTALLIAFYLDLEEQFFLEYTKSYKATVKQNTVV